MPDPIDELFIRIVETGSLKAAAREADADPSSVTRRLASLEARLGAKLLVRSTRRSQPTEAGQAYYEGIKRLVEEQTALEAKIAGLSETPRGLLRVTAPVDFGARFVTPVVDQLLSAYPDLAVELRLGSDFADLREGNVDVAVRIGKLADSALIARKFGEVPRALVAAPSYFAKREMPKRPEDLTAHTFIFYRQQREMSLHLHRGAQSKRISVTSRIAINSMNAMRDILFSGHGILQSPLWAVEDALVEGKVIPVLAEWRLPAYPLHGVFLETAFRPAKLRVFLDAMADQVKDAPSLTTI